MATLLHLDSGIQGATSVSRILSAAVVAQLTKVCSPLQVIHRDLVAAPLSHLTMETFGEEDAKAVLAEFLSAEIVVIGASMYNFTIPSQLKAWIDRILVAGATFRYGAEGPEGLVGDKRIIATLARGGTYGEDSPMASFEHAETYLRSVLAFIGAASPEFIIAEGTATGEAAKAAAIQTALSHIKALEASTAATSSNEDVTTSS